MPIFRNYMFIEGEAFRIQDAVRWIVWRCTSPDIDTRGIDMVCYETILELLSFVGQYGEIEEDALVILPWSGLVMRFNELIRMICVPVTGIDDDVVTVSTVDSYPTDEGLDLDGEEYIETDDEDEFVIHSSVLRRLMREDREERGL